MSKKNVNPALFKDAKVGRDTFKPLKHKDGRDFTDLDYFELLGRKCIELDKENANSRLPTDYGVYDRKVVEVAKNVCNGLDEGISKTELHNYISMCIKIDK